MKTATRLNGISEYYFSVKLAEIDTMRKKGIDVINLGIGSPDRPPHPSVIETLCTESAKSDTHAYQSYRGDIRLRKAFAQWYEKWFSIKTNPETEVLTLIGSKEGLMFVCMTYLNPGDEVLIPNPGYPTYRSAVTIASGTAVEYKLTEANDYQPDFEALEAMELSKVKLMIVNYPHMPTGTKAHPETFVKLVDFAKRHNILLVSDNPYAFVRSSSVASILSCPGAMDTAIELNSLSKSHNMAGWRVGAIFGKKERIDEILTFKSNQDSGMFLPVQLAAATALSLDEQWYRELNAAYYEREQEALRLMELIGCRASSGQSGLFVWGRIPEKEQDCYTFIDKFLHENGVFITPGGIFGSEGERYVRISLCSSKERLKEAAERIKNNRK